MSRAHLEHEIKPKCQINKLPGSMPKEVLPTPAPVVVEKKPKFPNKKLLKKKQTEDVCPETSVPKKDDDWERIPCSRNIRLRPEDEISLDSIFSALLAPIEPTEDEFKKCTWGLGGKDLLNEKQAILFEENLLISTLKDVSCKLQEETKVFLETELVKIGTYCLNIEESYDGYVVFSKSNMKKPTSNAECGHSLKGKYDDNFLLICEKRVEFDYVDDARVEKTLDARIIEDKLYAKRSVKINNESKDLKADIDMKGREELFIMDGGIMLLVRFLIINKFCGDIEYYTMNLFGRVMRCIVTIHKEPVDIKFFYKQFKRAIRVVNTQYFNDCPQDVSETYYQSSGRIIYHCWRKYNYIIHAVKPHVKPIDKLIPRLELLWKSEPTLYNKFLAEKKANLEESNDYLSQHPEISDLINDYVYTLLKYKPESVFPFTARFFLNFANRY